MLFAVHVHCTCRCNEELSIVMASHCKVKIIILGDRITVGTECECESTPTTVYTLFNVRCCALRKIVV